MKDTIITVERKKAEIRTFGICFLLANLVNIYAIVAYTTSIKEIVTQIGYVFLLAVVLYLLRSILLIMYILVKK
ncbi:MULTISPECIES: hypothetical protein [Bacteroides]|nr:MULTISPECIES: hypothetical protein [Bacteroides]